MNDQKKSSPASSVAGISEAERMAKIRELLVGPVIADESARVDKSVDQLNELVKAQHQELVALQTRVRELEEKHHIGMARLQLRLLGLVEAVLADDDDLRMRVAQHRALSSRLENGSETRSA